MNCGSVTQLALDPELAAEDDGSLLHSQGAQSELPGFIKVNATAVVPDHDGQLVVGARLQHDPNSLGAAVQLDVGESLFDDPIEVEEGRWRDCIRPSWEHRQLCRDASLFLEPGDQAADRADEAVAASFLTSKVVKQLTKTVEDLPSRVLDRIQLAKNVRPADWFRLEVLEVDEHSGKCLRNPVMKLTGYETLDVSLDGRWT